MVTELLIIGLVGMPGSGKGECAKIAAEQGFTVVNMGDLVREYTKKSGLDLTDENIGGTAHAEREKFGYDIWAKRTVGRIKELNLPENELVVIDGIRGESEVKMFYESFGEDFKTIGIKMPKTRRFELLQQRSRSDAPMTFQEFEIRESREVTWGIKKALDDTDYIILNTGTLEELEESFYELLNIIQEREKE